MMESGAKDFDLTNWYGLFAPAGTPPAIVNRLNAEVLKILAEPEIKERLAKMGSAVDPLSGRRVRAVHPRGGPALGGRREEVRREGGLRSMDESDPRVGAFRTWTAARSPMRSTSWGSRARWRGCRRFRARGASRAAWSR